MTKKKKLLQKTCQQFELKGSHIGNFIEMEFLRRIQQYPQQQKSIMLFGRYEVINFTKATP